MRRYPLYLILAAIVSLVWTSCDNEDHTWDDYADWRELNEKFISEQEARLNDDGTPYYTRLVPDWDPEAYILIHFFNDRQLTAGNLTPLYTSKVDVKYRGTLYNGDVFDSSYSLTANGDSIYRTRLNNVIEGWVIALTNMHVGDTCEIVVPYKQGYGASNAGKIKPYSTLCFGIKLVDIPAYEIR